MMEGDLETRVQRRKLDPPVIESVGLDDAVQETRRKLAFQVKKLATLSFFPPSCDANLLQDTRCFIHRLVTGPDKFSVWILVQAEALCQMVSGVTDLCTRAEQASKDLAQEFGDRLTSILPQGSPRTLIKRFMNHSKAPDLLEQKKAEQHKVKGSVFKSIGPKWDPPSGLRVLKVPSGDLGPLGH